MRAAIVGTGWMAAVHTEALRRIGVEVVGMVGSTPERTRSKANPLLPQPYDSLDELLAVDGLDSVHITSPNDVHAEQARAALAAGKHVVCEKPLGVDSSETAELVGLAAEAGVVNAVCFNARFYPLNQHAAALVRAGEIGQPRLISGQYLQDWLLLETDWNWRLDAGTTGQRCGPSPTSARTGSTSCSSSAVNASSRCSPTCTRSSPSGGDPSARWRRSPQPASTPTSLASASRWRATTPPVCCCASTAARAASARSARCRRDGATAWRGRSTATRRRWPGPSDDPDHLWIGHRGRPNEIVEKDPALLTPGGCRGDGVPRRSRRGLPRHVPGPVHRGLRRHRRGRSGRRSRTIRRSPTATTSWRCATPSPRRRTAAAWARVDRR